MANDQTITGDQTPTQSEAPAAPRRRRKKSKGGLIVVVLVVVAIALGVWYVFIRRPAVQSAENLVVTPGRIAGDEATVSAKVAGRVREIHFREGDSVKAGDVIALLDDDQVKAREDAAKSAVEQAEARVRSSQQQISVLRAQEQSSSISVDQSKIDSQGRVNQARANVAAAEAEANRADLQIVAPFDGTITVRSVEPGEVINPGTAIVTLVNLQELYLRVFVPIAEIDKVQVGQPARIYLDSQPDRAIEASVSRIDPDAAFTPENTYYREDRIRQVVGVKLAIKNSDGSAKPGVPGEGEILVEGSEWPARTRRQAP